MLGRLALITMVACGSCMEMRETVERMVMVRTTGSDLQPAATGYIYKKKNDGKESVIEMGESEVMEHLSKLYEQPKAFAAPIPIAKGRAINIEEDENKSESQSEERIIPVKEKQEDHIDGIADEDYKKIFDDYLSQYGDNRKAYDEYVHSLGHFGDGLYHGYKDNKHDDDGFEEYKKKHNYGNGKAGDYHNEKYESYAYSGKGHNENQDGAKDYEKHYGHDDQNDEYKKADQEKDDAHGFHKVFDKYDNQQQKEHKIYDNGDKIHKFTDGHKYHGDGGYEKIRSYESGHEGKFRKSDHHDDGSGAEDQHSEGRDISIEKHGDFEPKGRQAAGRSYGFEVEH